MKFLSLGSTAIVGATLASLALLCSPARSQAGAFAVSQYDPGSGSYTALGVITAYTTADDILTFYGYDGNHNNMTGGPVQASDRAELFLVDSAKSGLCLVYLLDAVGDGTVGRAELAVDLGPAFGARWLLKDDVVQPTLPDAYQGIPGDIGFAAIHGWGGAYSDGGVIGNLDGCGSAPFDFVFSDFDGTPGNEIQGLNSFVAASGDGSEIALVLATDRPVRLTPLPGYRVSQFDPLTNNWEVLGHVSAFPVTGGVNAFYQYDGNHHGIDPSVFVPTSDRSHLLLLNTTTQGLCLVYLHDQVSDGSGGHAELAFHLQDDGDGMDWLLQDDPYNPALADAYTGSTGESDFTAINQWNTIYADGGVLGNLDQGWRNVQVWFTDLDGSPGNEFNGLTSWAVHSADGSSVELVLTADRRVRIDACTYPGIWQDLGNALASGYGPPRLLGTGVVTANSPNWLTLRDARPNAMSMLFLSPQVTPISFKGGTLMPLPILWTFNIPTGPQGLVDLPFLWPAGISGFPLCSQYAIADSTAPQQVSLSNAVYFVSD